MTINTKHSFISSTGCHHAENILCKITEIWRLQPVVLSLPDYTLLPQALWGIEFLAHVTLTCIES